MWKSLTFAAVLLAGLFVSPTPDNAKTESLIELAHADSFPCAVSAIVLPTIIIEEEALPNRTKKQTKAKKQKSKKKSAVSSTKSKGKYKSKLSGQHKSKMSSGKTKIPTSFAPIHLTGPPGCG